MSAAHIPIFTITEDGPLKGLQIMDLANATFPERPKPTQKEIDADPVLKAIYALPTLSDEEILEHEERIGNAWRRNVSA